jgi:hypothetical protein
MPMRVPTTFADAVHRRSHLVLVLALAGWGCAGDVGEGAPGTLRSSSEPSESDTSTPLADAADSSTVSPLGAPAASESLEGPVSVTAEPSLASRSAAIEAEVGAEPRLLDESELETLLTHYCGECHQGHTNPPSSTDPGVSMIDVDLMLEHGDIIPGDAAASPLITRITSDSGFPMPHALPGRPVPADTLLMLRAFIDALPR